MTKIRSIPFSRFSSMLGVAFLGAMIFEVACVENGTRLNESAKVESGKVLGIAFVSLQVDGLERSMAYYQALGFSVVGESEPAWIRDDAANRLYNTPGAMSRTATLRISSTGSGQPFTLYLREYKDINRGSRSFFSARAPSSAHLGLMVPDADTLWEQLQSKGQLRPLSWDGKLIRMPGQTSGGLAYVQDPDGFNVEIIDINPGSADAGDTPAPLVDYPTLHHLGHVVMNSDRSKAFYGDLLGAEFPDKPAEWVSGDNYDAVVGGHGYVIRLINGTFPEALAPPQMMRFELVEYQNPELEVVDDYRFSDIAVSCVGLQVAGIDALYAELEEAGVEIWSQGGIVAMRDGTRAVVVRDPDVGAFVELFE
jgi:catechol 2,3-dioxygenase-like lactoylglutathione lyase family enzyme